MGARPLQKIFRAKNRKIAIGAYSSPERKRISERFCTHKCKNVRFLAILSKLSAVTPCQTFTVNSPRSALQVWTILWAWTHKRRWTIRLKKLEFLRSAQKSHIRPLVIRKIRRISKKENKLFNLRYIGYITANLRWNIPSSCWDRFTSTEIDPNLSSDKFADLCDSSKIFCCNPPSNYQDKQSLGCLTSVENFVDQSE